MIIFMSWFWLKKYTKKNLVRRWVLVLSLMSILKTKDKIETQIGTD